MRFRWTRVILVGIAGAAVVIGVGGYFVIQCAKPQVFPLRDVLWVRGASGQYHPPGSPLSLEYVRFFRSRDPDVDGPKYVPFILINAAVDMTEGDALTPFMVLNWSPPPEPNGPEIPTTDSAELP